MASHGIKDRVAIVGMGCTPLRRALGQGRSTTCCSTPPARRSPPPGITKDDVDAYWLGTAQVGHDAAWCSSKPLQLEGKPVTARRELVRHRLRGAAPGRLRGGVGRLRRGHGHRRREGEGLRATRASTRSRSRPTARSARSPRRPCSRWSRPAYAERYGVDRDELQGASLARIASKNHYNGARNPRAQFRREMSVEQICAMPAVAGDLSRVRLRGRGRRRGRGDRRAGPRTPTGTRTSRST